MTEKKLFVPESISPPLLKAARTLRCQQTDAERLLWSCLRRRQLGGFRFRRQHPIERYVLDFYCCEAKLAIELDGGQHNEPEGKERDKERTAWLGSKGISVIRFWNNEVVSDRDGVLEQIYEELRRRLPPPSQPPPAGGRSKLTPA
ncbi:MAG: endonuclease domain-containing protein [Desulfuromonadales bacterium]|nr:endonuclease domain-containing protein [Desulfuromonadales bacterium]